MRVGACAEARRRARRQPRASAASASTGVVGMAADAEQSLLQIAVGGKPRAVDQPVDAAVDHDGDFARHRRRDADVLLDDEHGDVALLAEPDQHLLDLRDDHRRQPLGRLVHHQQLRVGQQARARSPASAARRRRAGRRRCSCARRGAERFDRCARPSRRRAACPTSCADARRRSANAKAGAPAGHSRRRAGRRARARSW